MFSDYICSESCLLLCTLQILEGRVVPDGQSKFEEGAVNEDVAEHNNGPKHLMYASLDYSLLNRRPGVATKRENTETEYAEVKVKEKKEIDLGDLYSEVDHGTKDYPKSGGRV